MVCIDFRNTNNVSIALCERDIKLENGKVYFISSVLRSLYDNSKEVGGSRNNSRSFLF